MTTLMLAFVLLFSSSLFIPTITQEDKQNTTDPTPEPSPSMPATKSSNPVTNIERLPVNPSSNSVSSTGGASIQSSNTEDKGLCDFGGPGNTLSWCTWTNNAISNFNWKLGSGKTHLVMGGPSSDATTGTENGGYAYLEMSEKSCKMTDEAQLDSFLMESTVKNPEGAEKCVSFSYLISNSGSLEVIMKDIKTNATKILWSQLTPNKDNKWSYSSFLYAHDDQHQIRFIGRPTNPLLTRKRLGCDHLAIDDLKIGEINDKCCNGHCSFTKDFCQWTNAAGDDFDWELERSSQYSDNGPFSDHSHFGKFSQIGGYAFISSEYPRQPNEVSRLVSREFEASDSPVCMKFYVNLFGANDGQLRVFIQTKDSAKVKWIIPSGNDKQSWIKSQVLLSARENFKVIFEAQVSSRGRGKIAIDDISFHRESCIAMPIVDANNEKGVCDFEQSNLCGWSTNSSGTIHKWIRKSPSIGGVPEYDFKKHNVSGYYMGITGGGYSSASLISPIIESSEMSCISFMYIMWKRFAEQLGPSLGNLKVFLLTELEFDRTRTLLWKLSGHHIEKWDEARAPILTSNGKVPANPYQIEIEEESNFPIPNGLKDESAVIAIDSIFIYEGNCEVHPVKAQAMAGDCEFETDTCEWIVEDDALTRGDASDFNKYLNRWTLPRPGKQNEIEDHTYKRFTGGYAFFHADKGVGSNEMVTPKLTGPVLSSTSNEICFTFWYRGTVPPLLNVTLSIKIVSLHSNGSFVSQSRKLIWKVISVEGMFWKYGRIPIILIPNESQKVQFEGSAINAGYAIDDVKVLEGSCRYEPPTAGENLEAEAQKVANDPL